MSVFCLVIDAEESLAARRRGELARCGVRTLVVASFARAFDALESWHFDAIVVNVSAFGPDGLGLLGRLRAHRAVPLLALVDPWDERRQIVTLESGATDVLPSSASPELVAVKLLRLLDVLGALPERALGLPPPIGSLTIDPRAGLASVDGVALALTPYQFQLVALLASRTGEVVSREDVVQILMGTSDIRVVDVQVSRIRKKLNDLNANDVVLRTVRGRGYSLAMSEPGRRVQ